jgi:chromosome segregation ATPase
MTSSALRRATRKVAVLGATASVVGAGAVCVQSAASWRAAEAPLDATPVSANTIGASLEAEHQRTQALAGQLDQVTLQMADLQSALYAANGAMADQTGATWAVQGQLDGAQSKLTAVQRKLKAAQKRLAQLNAAAARQAALNAAATRTSPTKRVVTSTGGSGKKGGEHDDDDD